MEKDNFYDAVVIGGGPAGLTAGLYLSRACYRVLVIEKETFGGQITITSEVVNYPGTGQVSGKSLTQKMRQQAESFGCEFMSAEVSSIDVDGDVRRVKTDRGEVECLGLIIATGAHPREIGFEGEAEFKGHGVAYCATCDGEFFSGKQVFVVGGGYAAAEEALFLTKYATSVTILVRGDDFTCAKAVADETRSHPNITVLTNTEVVKVEGDEMLRSITYKNTKSGETTTFAPKDDTFGVFVFAGYCPSTDLVKDIVDLDERGYIITDQNQKTSLEGIYGAGDVCIKNLRQVVTATSDGAIAATELEKYISLMQKETGRVAKAPEPKRIDVAGGDSDKATEKGGSLFSSDDIAQLKTVFERMESPLVLELHLDGGPVSAELKSYMEELASYTDKLSVAISSDTDAAEHLPFVSVLRADLTQTGIGFHGVPGGHEFTSFILGLYNASGPGQQIDEASVEKISKIDSTLDIQILVSLSCTMCPELVTAAQRVATLNSNVSAHVYDINHFPDLKDKYNVMSVPCCVINDGQKVFFGKKNVQQLLEEIAK